MADKSPPHHFMEAKDLILENLEAIRLDLIRSVDEGMMDLEDALYNQVLELIEETRDLRTWEEIEALVPRAKILEQDIAAWLAIHGRASLSLPWPSR